MKKLFTSLFVAFAMIAMVSCSSNPAIDAAEDFIDNPTKENYEKVDKAVKELDEEGFKEYLEWCKENDVDLAAALFKALN